MGQNEDFLELQLEYIDVLNEQLDEIESFLLQEEPHMKNLLRVIHSVKGTAGSYDMNFVTTICHQMEDVLIANLNISELNKEDKDHLLKRLDLIKVYAVAFRENNEQKMEELASIIQATHMPSKEIDHKVLIVENSKVQKKMIARVLQKMNLHVSYCETGLQALERLATEKFDSLISGSELKGLNGPSLIRALKVIDSVNNNIPTILITATGHDIEGDFKPDLCFCKNETLLENIESTYLKMLTENDDPEDSEVAGSLGNIMFVDDCLMIHKLLEVSFKRISDMKIKLFSSGAESLEAFTELKPDLVVLDVNMLDMDGPEVLNEIRETYKSDVPVFFLTAEVDDSLIRGLDYQGVLKKPFMPKKIPHVIRKMWSELKLNQKAG